MTAPKLHRTRWTREEDAFLEAEWDGTRETAAVIADLLGRTPNATAQRHYELTWGTAAEAVEIKPEPGEIRTTRTTTTVRITEVTIEVTEDNVCPDCHLLLPASGACGYC